MKWKFPQWFAWLAGSVIAGVLVYLICYHVIPLICGDSNSIPILDGLNSDEKSPQASGTKIRWIAFATDPEGDAISYRFYLKGPSTGGAWQQVRDWSSNNQWDWTPSQQGDYEINVWIRDGKHAEIDSCDSSKVANFTITAVNKLPVVNSLESDKASPQNVGTSIKWTASATDPEGDAISYRFYLSGPSTGGVWQQVRDWNSNNQWDWTPFQEGSYKVKVCIRDENNAEIDSCDSSEVASFLITVATNKSPVANSLVSDKASPQNVGTSIKWTASATDPEGDAISYRFYLSGPSTGGVWQQVRDWNSNNQWDWTSFQEGSYKVKVCIRDENNAEIDSCDSSEVANFLITVATNKSPVVNSLIPDKASPQNVGTSIKWTASATDPESDTILYSFWLKRLSTEYDSDLMQDWSTQDWWEWAPEESGSYEVGVRVKDGNHADFDNWDDHKAEKYEIAEPELNNTIPMIVAHIESISPSNPKTGERITFYGTATAHNNISIDQYEWWVDADVNDNNGGLLLDSSTPEQQPFIYDPARRGSLPVSFESEDNYQILFRVKGTDNSGNPTWGEDSRMLHISTA